MCVCVCVCVNIYQAIYEGQTKKKKYFSAGSSGYFQHSAAQITIVRIANQDRPDDRPRRSLFAESHTSCCCLILQDKVRF